MLGLNRKKTSRYRLAVAVSHTKARFFLAKPATDVNKRTLEPVLNDVLTLPAENPERVLTEFFSKYKKLNLESTPTTLVLAPQLYESIQVEPPSVPTAEIADSLKFSLKELMSYSPDNAAIDYYELPFHAAGSEKIVALATAKEPLQRWVAMFRQHKLSLQNITAAETVLAALSDDSARGQLVIYENGEQGYLIQIYHKQQLAFSRQLRALRPLSEYSADEIDAGALEPLATEVQRSMDYYESQLRQAQVAEVVCAIEHRHLDKVTAKLNELLAVSCSKFEYPQWVYELAEGDYSDLIAIAALKQLLVAESAATRVNAEVA